MKKNNIKNRTDFVKFATNIKQREQNYPGEVLEIQVDPNKCFVGDLWLYNTITMYPTDKKWLKKYSEDYWQNIISLTNFKKYYQKVDLDYQKVDNAPEDLPEIIRYPEILVPETVSPKNIKVLKQEEVLENYRKKGLV